MFRTYLLTEKKEVKKCSSLEYVKWLLNHPNEARIKKTSLRNYIFISTFFMSNTFVNKNYMPNLFETVVFFDSYSEEKYTRFYNNYQDAIIGHREIVRLVIRKLKSMDNN